MRMTLTALFLGATLLPAGMALAGDDDCFVAGDQWQPREAVLQLAQKNGWTVREFEIDDGCYKIEGRNSDGRPIEVKLDPGSLRVVKMEYEDDGRRDSHALPKAGMSGKATAPAVQAN